ncbi:MAG: hypothetical protein DRN15_04360 [Thermoprotei archaeon]|nr:MAG: hypothetical protein DRM97_06225 [Thermoprotei archaeon]RLF23953.1 MAG: hypothetical protein DRN15_04360 [Thermoprotei archaeon]
MKSIMLMTIMVLLATLLTSSMLLSVECSGNDELLVLIDGTAKLSGRGLSTMTLNMNFSKPLSTLSLLLPSSLGRAIFDLKVSEEANLLHMDLVAVEKGYYLILGLKEPVSFLRLQMHLLNLFNVTEGTVFLRIPLNPAMAYHIASLNFTIEYPPEVKPDDVKVIEPINATAAKRGEKTVTTIQLRDIPPGEISWFAANVSGFPSRWLIIRSLEKIIRILDSKVIVRDKVLIQNLGGEEIDSIDLDLPPNSTVLKVAGSAWDYIRESLRPGGFSVKEVPLVTLLSIRLRYSLRSHEVISLTIVYETPYGLSLDADVVNFTLMKEHLYDLPILDMTLKIVTQSRPLITPEPIKLTYTDEGYVTIFQLLNITRDKVPSITVTTTRSPLMYYYEIPKRIFIVTLSIVAVALGVIVLRPRIARRAIVPRVVEVKELEDLIKMYDEYIAIRMEELRIADEYARGRFKASQYRSLSLKLKDEAKGLRSRIRNMTTSIIARAPHTRLSIRRLEDVIRELDMIVDSIIDLDHRYRERRLYKDVYTKIRARYERDLRRTTSRVNKLLVELKDMVRG